VRLLRLRGAHASVTIDEECVRRPFLFGKLHPVIAPLGVLTLAKQVEQGASLEAQEATLRQYASFHGFDEVEVIADEGLSGKTTARPGFQKVMDAVRAKTTEAVVVYSLSRFARNTIATLEAIEMMNKRGVAFHRLVRVSTPLPL
jgi:hypothetical protein